MTAQLGEQEVRRVASLSRLELTDDEVQSFSAQLTAVMEYMERLKSIDTTDAATRSLGAAAHAPATMESLREDQRTEPSGANAALANAPASQEGQFCVPKVLE